MPPKEHHHHRPTGLKQQNKPFKSRHASKGALKDKAKGKVNRTSVKSSVKKAPSKSDRRNTARQLQQNKREQLLQQNRLFDGRHGAPKIVAVVPLCPDVTAYGAVSQIFTAVGQEPPSNQKGSIVLKTDRFKHKFQFLLLGRNFYDILDAVKVSDYILLVMSAEVEVDSFGELCLTAIQQQGFPSVIPVVQHLKNIPIKKKGDVTKSLLSFTKHFFPLEDKVLALDNEQESLVVLRTLASQSPKSITWRDTRSYMLVDELSFQANADEPDTGILQLTGYARGAPFSADRLVHLPNWGDFQISQITSASISNSQRDSDGDGMDTGGEVLDTPTESQDDLQAENIPDLTLNEQTWPTEEELAEAEERIKNMSEAPMDDDTVASTDINNKFGRSLKKTKRVPKGTSAYQAAWIVDSEDDEEEYSDEYEESDDEGMLTDGEVDDDDKFNGNGAHVSADEEEEEEYEEVELEGKKAAVNEILSDEEEKRQLQAYIAQQRERQNREDLAFPDEVDTPLDIPARIRFQRYRGMQSFRTSPWDPYENLPLDYGRIFQFENFRRTKRRMMSAAIRDGRVKAGTRVTLHLRDVAKEVSEWWQSHEAQRPMAVFGLLQHEHKMTALNFVVTRNTEYTEPVKSKDPLIIQSGFRRFRIHPLFSQNTRGGTNNVHKFERFFNPGQTVIATAYGPVHFGINMPVLMLRESSDINTPILVASGSVLDSQPERIIAKRIVLSGHPFKIHKKSAVVRYMFFNPEDVTWFKPVQLHTKHGRSGHIKESLGTHGYMKCIFDGPLQHQDTVCMYLYKRVFPKWNTELYRGALQVGDVATGVVEKEGGEMEL
ncbi:uncharacterized protein VTP21DRAFT_6020 [Calcarisporiella thermophila]|uniref:uncharacterized protein n=1 Tax=Calcarisporiella thermophila TaxID=911321 RepID=UPI00374240C0